MPVPETELSHPIAPWSSRVMTAAASKQIWNLWGRQAARCGSGQPAVTVPARAGSLSMRLRLNLSLYARVVRIKFTAYVFTTGSLHKIA